jgi:hypothetical protein
MREIYETSESRDWKQARRSAFVQEVLSIFTQRPLGLMSFEQVQQQLQLDNVHYLDLQDVPLDLIVGSVGRYTDFTRAFFPRTDHLQQRWRRIEQLVATGHGLPPIELYKAGQVYFVRDGNHRVSVARQHGHSSIDAYVWEYETDVPLGPDCDIDDLLCRIAHTAFLERTNIDRRWPDLHIRLTQPDGYGDLLCEIEAYQQILSGIDGREIPFDEAVALWCEIRYLPIIEIIRQRHVLEEFPGRTETDLYLWLCHNQGDLEARYERRVLMEEVADDLAERLGENPLPARQIKGAAGWLAGIVVNWATGFWSALRQALGSEGRRQ